MLKRIAWITILAAQIAGVASACVPWPTCYPCTGKKSGSVTTSVRK